MKTRAALVVLSLTAPHAHGHGAAHRRSRRCTAGTGWPSPASRSARPPGAMIFQKGGNAVDAACAMLAAVCTMWDTLSWGGETQALIYNPKTKKVIGINALGVGADRRHARVLPVEGHGVPAGVRPARRGHAGHAGRPAGDARRVRHDEPRRRCSRRRSRWPTATPSSSRPPTRSSARRTKSRSGRRR